MNWKDFKAELNNNPMLLLQFEYAENKRVEASYHITEIKHAPITAVDCGGVVNKWTEVIIQLWEPVGEQQERAMQVGKALSIIKLVESTLVIEPEATVKIEFGNTRFDTRQMHPAAITCEGENLVVYLHADKTQCKAIDRGGSCGTDDKGEELYTGDIKTDKINCAKHCLHPG